MKIVEIEVTEPLYLDLVPLGDSRGFSSGPRAFSFLRVSTDDGLVGVCPTWGPSSGVKAFALEVFRPLVVGMDPFEVEKIWEKCYWTTLGSGRRGASMRALSYIDIAIWDIIGKVCKQPIHRLLGGHKDRVPAYGSFFNLPYSIKDLVEQNQRFVEMGFRMVKMKIGQSDTREDLRRIKAVRDAIGYDIDIAVDANNVYGVHTAIAMAKRMERYEIYWFEEPVLLDNVEGIVKLAKSTSIPIAGYELENTKYGFKELITRGAIDICQADATICGGITEWRKIAALAECHGIPVAPHGMEQLHVPLVAAIPNGLIVEWAGPFVIGWKHGLGSRIAELVENPIVPKDGMMACKVDAGLGIEVSDEALQRYGERLRGKSVRRMNPRFQWPPYA